MKAKNVDDLFAQPEKSGLKRLQSFKHFQSYPQILFIPACLLFAAHTKCLKSFSY